MACEVVAQTQLPLSRQSLTDLVGRAQATLGRKVSRTTVWRMLHEAAIKPWQYEYWIYPRDPRFAEKAGPILDLYAGTWHGKPLGPRIASSALTRRQVSRREFAVTRRWARRQGEGGVSSLSMTVAAPFNTSRHGTSDGAL